MEFYFRTSKEVICFCENLFTNYKQIELHWKKEDTYGNYVYLLDIQLTKQLKMAITKSLVSVFYSYHLTKTLKQIIKNNYYFSNKIEIERIMENAYLLLIDDLGQQIKQETKQKLINVFEGLIKVGQPIHFESTINFQLTTFKEELISVVGLAIDEFKREEQHQEFIYSIRKFMKRKPVVFKEVHVLQDKNFIFFKPTGEQFSKFELNGMLNKEPLYIIGLSPSDYNLAPFIAMSPAKIFIYGTDPFEAKTQSVINIFQEKVTFKTMNEFPFSDSNHLRS